MEQLASAIPAGEVGRVAYRLYERFRPAWKASAGRWGGAGGAGQVAPEPGWESDDQICSPDGKVAGPVELVSLSL